MRSQPITLYYSRSEVPGALYYWSTGAQGVLKATISSEVATKFFTDPSGTDTTCVSCHTVSRNGKKLAAAYGGEKLRAITVPNRELLIPSDPDPDPMPMAMPKPKPMGMGMGMGIDYAWGTFSPDASRLFYATKGKLAMLDANDGTELFKVTLPDAALASHPDWAPSGKHIAISYGAERLDNKNVQGTSIARLPVEQDGTLGDPEILRASSDGTMDTLFFPSYSPNSKWIAFVRATGKSKDNVTSTLYLLPAEGGDPIELTRLNERVRYEDGITGIGNSMPTWAPSTKPDVFWIAFSSLRAYGDVSGGGLDQLWAVAIDPAKIEAGEDPSYAAFWLPFQDLKEGNHRAFWAIDAETACPGKVEICDDLDNDCDGVVDEECCVPADEVCDGADNNCDGVVDEGCCMPADDECCMPSDEVCDGEDNNCDGVVDEGCCIPSEEICDGADNNCDGATDEGCCTPSEEVCDGVDNDCDLVKDEGCGCEVKEICGNEQDDDCDGAFEENCVD